MQSKDLVRLRHMLDAAEEAVRFAAGKSPSDLKNDRMLSLAIVRLIEIVGEAASRVSEDGKVRLPEAPWQDIVGMRNRIVHAYFDIDLDIVWLTVVKFLPDLILLLKGILDDEP
jgi:uncharacterized protein with HEPN domain